jgi:hypothetical protein
LCDARGTCGYRTADLETIFNRVMDYKPFVVKQKEVATCFEVSWDHVCNSVKQAVSWGLSHRNLDGIASIGLDEVHWKRGHKDQTPTAGWSGSGSPQPSDSSHRSEAQPR